MDINKEQVTNLLQQHSTLKEFEVYFLGFYHATAPRLELPQLFQNVKNIADMETNKLLNHEEKLHFLLTFLKKNLKNHEKVIPNFEEFFKKTTQLIQDNNITDRYDIFFLGYCHAAAPDNEVANIFSHLKNITEMVSNGFLNVEEKDLFLQSVLMKLLKKELGDNEPQSPLACSAEEERINGMDVHYELNFDEITKLIEEFNNVVEFDLFFLGFYFGLDPKNDMLQLFKHVKSICDMEKSRLLNKEDKLNVMRSFLNKVKTDKVKFADDFTEFSQFNTKLLISNNLRNQFEVFYLGFYSAIHAEQDMTTIVNHLQGILNMELNNFLTHEEKMHILFSIINHDKAKTVKIIRRMNSKNLSRMSSKMSPQPKYDSNSSDEDDNKGGPSTNGKTNNIPNGKHEQNSKEGEQKQEARNNKDTSANNKKASNEPPSKKASYESSKSMDKIQPEEPISHDAEMHEESQKEIPIDVNSNINQEENSMMIEEIPEERHEKTPEENNSPLSAAPSPIKEPQETLNVVKAPELNNQQHYTTISSQAPDMENVNSVKQEENNTIPEIEHIITTANEPNNETEKTFSRQSTSKSDLYDSEAAKRDRNGNFVGVTASANSKEYSRLQSQASMKSNTSVKSKLSAKKSGDVMQPEEEEEESKEPVERKLPQSIPDEPSASQDFISHELKKRKTFDRNDTIDKDDTIDIFKDQIEALARKSFTRANKIAEPLKRKDTVQSEKSINHEKEDLLRRDTLTDFMASQSQPQPHDMFMGRTLPDATISSMQSSVQSQDLEQEVEPESEKPAGSMIQEDSLHFNIESAVPTQNNQQDPQDDQNSQDFDNVIKEIKKSRALSRASSKVSKTKSLQKQDSIGDMSYVSGQSSPQDDLINLPMTGTLTDNMFTERMYREIEQPLDSQGFMGSPIQQPANKRTAISNNANKRLSQREEEDLLSFELIRKLQEEEEKHKKMFQRPKKMSTREEEELSLAFITQLQDEDVKAQEVRVKEKIDQDNADAICSICFDLLINQKFRPVENCGHIFHDECLGEFIKMKIDERQFPLICPIDDCRKELTNADMKDIIDEKYRQKFEEYSLKQYIDTHQDELSCCPTADCNFAFVKEPDQIRLDCPICKKCYCINCRTDYHQGMTCKEYQITHRKDENDEKFDEFTKGMNLKKCPQCGAWVEKLWGCDHMACKCGYAFCYNCGQSKGKERAGLSHGCNCVNGQVMFRPVVMPQGGGLFGAGANPGGGLFGAPRPNPFGGGMGGGLFGGNVPNPGLFGNVAPGGLFNNYNNQAYDEDDPDYDEDDSDTIPEGMEGEI